MSSTQNPREDHSSQPLLPLRRLSNFVYCPRLMYLQWVENIFRHSAETIEGSALHERVNKPSHIDEGEELKELRSLALDSPRLGITGKIDYLRNNGDGVSIVEYKRGAAHRNNDGEREVKPWDKVQVLGQALLLKEHGYQVDEAFIYYAAEKRRIPVDLNDESLEWTKGLIADAVETARQETIPPPLENDWRCQYCSAQPICLPYESRVWCDPENKTDKSDIRPPMAENDEREVLVVQKPGSSVGRRGEQIVVSCNGDTIRKVPLHQLRSILLYGPVKVSSQVITSCLEEGVSLGFFAGSGRFLGQLSSLGASGVEARIGQYDSFRDSAKALALAREVVRGKIHNQRVMLMRNSGLKGKILDELKILSRQALRAEDAQQLLGIEGAAAALYFGSFSSMIGDSLPFDFQSRNRRPPRDPINSLLSLGYSCLVKELSGVISTVGLDPYFGFYHRPKYGRPALALDLMEEFRPLIADSVAITLVNKRQLSPSDFIPTSEGTFLSENGRKVFWSEWFRRLDTEVQHPEFGYKMSYRRMLEIQARQLWRFVRGEARDYHAFVVR